MKIRTGFVSNSSSSSFLVRGVLVKLETLGLNTSKYSYDYEYEIEDEIQKLFSEKNVKLKTYSNRFYFGGKPTGNIIFGFDIENVDDGQTVEITDAKLKSKDADIKRELIKLGIMTEDISTFFRYISNDNY